MALDSECVEKRALALAKEFLIALLPWTRLSLNT